MSDGSAGERSGLPRFVTALLLFRLANPVLDGVATAATAALVVVSRFAYLANGPWEWDETLFARGILDFDLAAHFPHPPGFPGWLAIGHVLTWIVDDPLVALQLASAAFSVAALWVLAAVGRRVASPPVAVAAALLVLAAPGPWLYSVRGFSSTAASVLALGAAAVAVGGLEGRRVSTFTMLVGASFLVRPNLMPMLAVLWLGVVWRVRPVRRLLPGVVGSAAAIAAAILLMVRAEGGWSAFAAAFLAHSQRHFSRLAGNFGGYADLGLVKGLGGVLPASAVLIVAALGTVVWWRRVGRRSAVLWVLVLSLAIAQLVWMQNRTTGRYAVGVQMALAPLVAGAAATVPPSAGVIGLVGLAGWFGASSYPLLEEQHTKRLPGWEAVLEAHESGKGSDRTVVVESELYPFASYLWTLFDRQGGANPPQVLSPWDPQPWSGIEGSWVVATVHRHFYADGVRGRERSWGGVSQALYPLTQQRFLEAWVIEDPPLPIDGWWPRERLPDGRPFMWGGPRSELLLPPLAAGSEIGVTLRPAPGPEPLQLTVDDEVVATVDGVSEELRRWIRLSPPKAGRPARLRFSRTEGYPPGHGDTRPLAVQLFEIRALEPGGGWSSMVTRSWQRQAMKIEIEGAFAAEQFPGTGEGMWLQPRAVVRLPAAAGCLRLRMWAPRPTPPRTIVRVAGRKATEVLEIGSEPKVFEVEILPGDVVAGRVDVEILSDVYRPGGEKSADRRELGVVLSELEIEPRRPAS